MSIAQKKSSPAWQLRRRLQTTICSSTGKKVSGTLWPNGEFSFAYVPESVTQVTRGEESSWAMPGPGESDEGASPLGSSLPHNLPEQNPTGTMGAEKARYGLNGMTSNARRKVRSSAYLLQERYGKSRLSFVTLTVPPLGRGLPEQQLASRWHDAIRYLIRRLKQFLRERGLPPCFVGVTELQTKRYASSGQFPLHIHLVLVGRKTSHCGWAIHYWEFRQAWAEILEGIVGHSIETSAMENVQEVEKNAGGYLGKYMSKSQNDVEKVKEDGNEWMLPKQWWFSTKEMKDWLKSRVSKGTTTGQVLEAIVHEVWDSPGEYPDLWLKKITVDLDGFEYVAGWVGIVPQEWLKDVESLLKLTL